MKTKKSDLISCVLFCGFLAIMLALYLFVPEKTFSEKEKRYLTPRPTANWDTIISGKFAQKAEDYLADHIPGRDFLVGLNAYYDWASNRQVTKEIYRAEGGRLVEAPQQWDAEAVRRNMDAINRFAQSAGCPVDLMIVPSAGYILEDSVQGLHEPYRDNEIIEKIYGMAQSGVVCRDILPALRGAQDPQRLYYRTDHHWTSFGAYTAYRAYMQMLGREYPGSSDFQVESHPGFLGSTYSRSGFWLTEPEDIEIWENETAFTVTNGESEEVHPGLFYEERLEQLDQYTVFLDGNHSVVTIRNPAAAGKGRILVIRDSYANCLGTFLANSYETVTLVDLRYYKKPVSELLAQEDYTDVLVCYSLGNFLTDANIVWLK